MRRAHPVLSYSRTRPIHGREFLAANLNGGSLLLEQAADTTGVLHLLVDRKVTHAAVVPTVLQRLLALPECKTADRSALSYVIYGASPIPLPVLREATEIIGCSRPAVQ